MSGPASSEPSGGVMKSVLTYCLSTWFSGCSNQTCVMYGLIDVVGVQESSMIS